MSDTLMTPDRPDLSPPPNTLGDVLTNVIQSAVKSITSLLFASTRELITVLRQPTPLKLTYVATANAAGVIGGGTTTPDSEPVEIWQCPLSHEAWLNRISIQSPGHGPAAPLTTGQAIVRVSTGQLAFMLPTAGALAPLIITEGRLSAVHMNSGERLVISADGLPANTVLRFDFQVMINTGLSVDTPRVSAAAELQTT